MDIKDQMPISYNESLELITEQIKEELKNYYPDDVDDIVDIATDVYTQRYQSTAKLTNILTANWTPNEGILSNLFDVDSASTASLEELKRMYPSIDIYVLLPIVVAGSLQDKLCSDIENLQSQKIARQHNTQEQINKMNILQKKRLQSALDMETQGYRSARAGIRMSGKDTTEADLQEPPRKRKWWEYLIVGIVIAAVAVAAVVIGAFTFGLAGAIVGAIAGLPVLFAVWSITNSIAQAAINSIGDPYKRSETQAKYSQYDLCSILTDMVVDIRISTMNLDPENVADKAKIEDIRQKTQMAMNITMSVLGMIATIAMGIAATVLTGGAGAEIAVVIIVGAISAVLAALDVVAGAFSVIGGQRAIEFAHKKLEEAKVKREIAEIDSAIELFKNQMEMIDQRIDFLTELFSSSTEAIQKEIKRAADVLKDINNARLTIARNIGA